MSASIFRSWTGNFSISLLAGWLLAVCLSSSALADESAWIWTPKKSGIAGVKPQGDCYFRKKFTLVGPQKAEIIFAAGDEYEIYLNGRLATQGQSFGEQIKVDVSELIEPGVNLLAARIRHYQSPKVGLSLKFRVKESGDTRWRSLSTDDSWKTRTTEVAQWNISNLNDMAWINAQVIKLAQTTPPPEAKPTSVAQTNPPATRAAAPQTPTANTTAAPNTSRMSASRMSAAASQTPTAPMNIKAAPPQTPVAKSTTNQTVNKPAVAGTSVQPVSTRLAAKPQTQVPPAAATPQAAVNRPSAAPATSNTRPEPGQGTVVAQRQRFEIDPEFKVQQIMSNEETGSVIAMAFNEFGKLLLSKEGGPLMIADLSIEPGQPGRMQVCCEQVSSCQGILPLNGDIFVTGLGPQGLGLYLLTDPEKDGRFTTQRQLLAFSGQPGEHGPHAIQLGADGMIYVIVGNGSQVINPLAESSPLKYVYEGDLVPRFEDPGGHAVGVKAPGGTVVRVSLDGSKVERVAGGIRNAFDLTMDQNGEMFIHDSDMESDMGTTWYRPTTLFHVAAGSELGWRSGWSKFPEYFADQTPMAATTGRGSPTGAVLYQHLQFPTRYQDCLFFADWSEGRILSFKPERSGAGYTGTPEVFLKGRPLNVCDLAVGEDGGLYFCTGGRGTQGGVYRVVWNGEIPEEMLRFDSDLIKALRHPQPTAAWARQNIANIRIQMGQEWGKAMTGVALESRNTSRLRVRALQLMVLFGPAPNDSLLTTLAKDEDVEVRAQIARLCGLRASSPVASPIVEELLGDSDPLVRRIACESCIRLGLKPDASKLVPMLASLDRVESQAARRVLEHIPVEQWESTLIKHEEIRVFMSAAMALMNAEPSLQRSYEILARCTQTMDGFVNDRDFVDLLRTMQIAMAQGQVDPSKIGGLTTRIIDEFPSNSPVINLELARLLGFLQAGDFSGRLEEYLADEEVPTPNKVHVAMHLIHARNQLTRTERLAIVNALETARLASDVGGSYDLYIQNAIEKVSENVAQNDLDTILKNGHRWPKTVLAAFHKLPTKIDDAMEQSVIELDQKIRANGQSDRASQQVRLGVIAILARDGDPSAMEYLRKAWQEEPARRNDIVIGLAEQPEGENWSYLVSSLADLDDLTSEEILTKLTTIARRPKDAQYYRQVIELGYRLRGNGALAASKLMQHWSAERLIQPGQNWEQQLQTWKTWFEQRYPNESPISIPNNNATVGRYSVGQVLGQLERTGLGNASRGAALFASAQCATCHTANGTGTSVGPDLTNLAGRFSLREAVESTIDPSAVVPDRYASKTIRTIDGLTISGMAMKQSDDSWLVLQSDGQRIRIQPDDVEAIKDHPQSAMPEGLLDQLSQSEVADLFAYLLQSNDRTAATAASTR